MKNREIKSPTVPIDNQSPPLSMARSDRFCILGAGSSGLAAAKNFLERGIPFDCLEREDDVGGNWYYGKPHSSVYRSTRLISSKRATEYADFPMPAEWPEHPAHEQVWQYLRDYALRFGLREHIEFRTAVKWIEPAAKALAEPVAHAVDHSVPPPPPSLGMPLAPPSIGVPLAPPVLPALQQSLPSGWDVTLSDGERRRYRGIVIANGHNWDPRWPDFPGDFPGETIHSSQYKTPEAFRERRVLVVGGGNSGFDIAVDVAPHATTTFHSLRRAYHVLPRFFQGTPIDQCGEWMQRWRLPLWLRRLAAARTERIAWREMLRDLPRPDHRLFETHPVINSRWPHDVVRGKIKVKPNVRELAGDEVVFDDGSREPVDAIVYATGYKLSFPFIDHAHLNWQGDRPELYLNVFHPERDDLFVVGLIQPNSGQFGLVDHQSRLIASYVGALRSNARSAIKFQRAKRAGQTTLNGGIRYVHSPRHLIEVEHHSYGRQLEDSIRGLAENDDTRVTDLE